MSDVSRNASKSFGLVPANVGSLVLAPEWVAPAKSGETIIDCEPLPPRPLGPCAHPLLLLVAGVVAAIVSWRPLDANYTVYPSLAFAPVLALDQQPGLAVAPWPIGSASSKRSEHAGFAFALFGASLGVLLGFTEGASRRSIPFAIAGALLGGLFGLGFGYIGGWTGQLVSDHLRWTAFDRGIRSVIMQSTALVTVGAGVGLAIGLLTRRVDRTFLCGICGAMGGLLGAVAVVPSLGILFPLANTDVLIPSGFYSRLCWLMVPGGMIGLAIGYLRPSGLPWFAPKNPPTEVESSRHRYSDSLLR